jgi:membrane protein DedA with SNARE-associated domain
MSGEQRVERAWAMMVFAPLLVCALLAWVMWWLWERQKRR